MKKLLVVLLALACVGAVSAQVTTSVAASGTAYLVNGAGSAAATANIAENGEWSDSVTFTAADKDGKFGGKVYVGQFDYALTTFDYTGYATDAAAQLAGTATADQIKKLADPTNYNTSINLFKTTNWDVWYQYDFGKFDIGTAGGGFNGDLNNDIVDHWDTDGFGTGIIYTTPAFGGLTADVYYNIPVTGTVTVENALKTSGASVQYVIENTLTVKALVQLGLVADSTKANAYFNFTGVPNLAVYGDVQWDQTKADSLAAIGAQYGLDALTIVAEFESNWGGTFAYDVVGQATYKVTDALSVRARGCYDQSKDDYYGKGYVMYAFGNGLSANLMLGYDKASEFIYALYLGYGISL